MKQHTPGPWAIESPDISGAPFRVRKAENHPQGDLTICHVNPYLAYESEANARLIAAAPDLLQAVEDFLLLATLHDWEGAAIDNAREALRKAKGDA
jgi:hypothetical protein